ncbi:MAG: DUF6807 family protein [Bryobacteraceae bacterium]
MALPLLAEVKIAKEDNRLVVTVEGKPLTTLYYGPGTMKPYLHPLYAASGTIVTRRWPMEKVEGETKDHPHHEGIWFTHGDVNGYNFWMKAEDDKRQGKVVVDRILREQSGGKRGTIGFTGRWLDGQGKAILREDRVMTFHDDRKIDLTSR